MDVLSKFIGKNSKNREIIVVSGLPRSGTSMLMRMLEEGGIEPLTDRVRTADHDNPRGYYEYEAVKKLKEGEYSWLPLARGKAVKIISALLSYLPPDNSYHVLFTQRSIQEVLASQRAMLVNRGEDPDKIGDTEMAATFEKHIAQVMQWLSSQKNISTLLVDYNKMIKDPGSDARRIASFLGNKLNVEKMIAVIEPDLYHHRG
jgi:hypothetical protein